MIVTDGQGTAWVGSDSGNVKRIELKSKQVTGSRPALWLEHVLTLKHLPKSRRSSAQFGSATSTELDDLSRAESGHASDDLAAADEPATAPGSKAHAGPVTAVEVHRNTLYTSGGSQGAAALHEWTQAGTLHHAHKLKDLGMLLHCLILHSNNQQRELQAGACAMHCKQYATCCMLYDTLLHEFAGHS